MLTVQIKKFTPIVDFNENFSLCDGDDCTKITGHMTGLCDVCRTLKCQNCGKKYTWIDPNINQVRKYCARCRLKVVKNHSFSSNKDFD